MKDGLLISIVIPVYNTEKYLRRCIQSILRQTYMEWELILVNDGSKDHSSDICHTYEKSDSRIKVIDQENQGVSVARNNGIDQAEGGVLFFVDADDWLEKDALMQIRNNWDEEVELCLFDNYEVFGKERKERQLFKKDRIDFSKDEIYNMKLLRQAVLGNYSEMSTSATYATIWARAYKTSFVKEKKIHFIPGVFAGEDLIFNLDCLCSMEKVRYLSVPVYNYYANNESVTGVGYTGRGVQLLDALKKSIRHVERIEIDLNEKKIIHKEYICMCIKLILWWTCDETDKAAIKKGHKFCVQNVEHIKATGMEGLSLSDKVIVWLCARKQFLLLETLIRVYKKLKIVLKIRL